MYLSLLNISFFQAAQDNQLELGEILEVEPIPFTFDTLGWKIVAIALLLLLAHFIYKFYLKYKSNQYRREAVIEIESLNVDSELTESAFITQSILVLKRIAMQTFSRQEVASLNGEAWLSFLDKKVTGVNFRKYAKEIEEAVYKDKFNPSSNYNKTEFYTMSIKWIKNHA